MISNDRKISYKTFNNIEQDTITADKIYPGRNEERS